jgi:hypothetical protein
MNRSSDYHINNITIETAHNNILNKIKHCINIVNDFKKFCKLSEIVNNKKFAEIYAHELPEINKNLSHIYLNILSNDIAEIENKYNLTTNKCLVEYYTVDDRSKILLKKTSDKTIWNQYFQSISEENIDSKIIIFINALKEYLYFIKKIIFLLKHNFEITIDLNNLAEIPMNTSANTSSIIYDLNEVQNINENIAEIPDIDNEDNHHNDIDINIDNDSINSDINSSIDETDDIAAEANEIDPYLDMYNDILSTETKTAQTNNVVSANIFNKKMFVDLYSNILNNINAAEMLKIDLPINMVDYERCKCGTMMDYNTSSELECPNCHITKKLNGTLINDVSNEDRKAKSDSIRHLREWLDKIQAKNKYDIHPADIQQIEEFIKKNKYTDMDSTKMRIILKTLKLQKYNGYCSLLIKLTSSLLPQPIIIPQLSSIETHRVIIKFIKIRDIYHQKIKKDNDKERQYYPYWIYKIIQIEFSHDEKKKELLKFIHLQSNQTIMKNDENFKKICDFSVPSDGLVFISTI